MFESAKLGHKIDKDDYREREAKLREALLAAQFKLKQQGDFPVVILLSGVPTGGRGEMASQLNEWMDPRHIESHAFGLPNDEEAEKPPLWRYWRALPPKGKTAIFFDGWYLGPMWDALRSGDKVALQREIERITRFERMLASEGVLLMKFWLHLPKADLKKRIKKLESDPLTEWRVGESDRWFLKNYDEIIANLQPMLQGTNLAFAPWRVVEAGDANYRSISVGQQLLEALNARFDKQFQPYGEAAPLLPSVDGVRLLDRLELTHALDKKDYEKRLAEVQGRLNQLTRKRGFKKMGVAAVFEGMDAAGKGGAIRRITAALDVRQYGIVPIAAPTEEERAQPYLWRFWRHVPSHGQVRIFDRSWYGRVLVERVEGFASQFDWMRAYSEINDFEAQLDAANTVVVKFWLAIDPDEQLRRFKEREAIEWKRFKITDEDWRNRDKWDDYIIAASDMIDRTSSAHAPWHLIGANNKYHARVTILEKLCDAIEARLKRKE
ncbi:polyphosphate:AMP phosphotransferase [Jeongeupia naejangsanensis]|uniref:Polyphosphate:AMP phosphotransferase n=1 Tax=Jeongeupia naejangsanensis TaxID=613195 RepID=A0ABS2BMQ0_9NEIS|nr:polyphosphate:AMP phosphotransferase [Jeongeupia naejangsanensis]MBM3116710.1 polyphosphate:AMP phosphotransferase [Jeongeupia naejangsanensis]